METDRHRKYNTSEKGKARYAKYQKSEKGKARWLKYSRSEKGKANDRRKLEYHDSYYGKAATVEQAVALNRHIKERIRAFKGLASGAQAEGIAASAVSAEASTGTD